MRNYKNIDHNNDDLYEIDSLLREMVSNILRVVRGAGKPHKIHGDVINVFLAFEEFKKKKNYYPTGEIVANILSLDCEDYYQDLEEAKINETDRNGRYTTKDVKRWYDDGVYSRKYAEHKMYCGALQIVASKLIVDDLREAQGKKELEDGIKNKSRR